MVPGWNAHVKLENATSEVGLGWTVTDAKKGEKPQDYHAQITLTVPHGAGDYTIVAPKPWEDVHVNRDASLTCGPHGIQAYATYNVSAVTGVGKEVAVKVCKYSGVVPPPTGDILVEATGQIGQVIRVDLVIPGTCA
jgi:hypothetical protein